MELIRDHLFVKELAERRGRNEFTIYHWLREAPHRLPPAYKWGGRVVFKIKDVEAWEASELVPYQSKNSGKKRGRPTKSVEIAKRKAKGGAA